MQNTGVWRGEELEAGGERGVDFGELSRDFAELERTL